MIEEENDNILNEPAASYGVSRNTFQETPSFVLDDFRIGMKQYLNGECIDAEEFMQTLDV